ncbi:hypothetical protein JHK82_044349 [Glycine max]|nr:hypothetical protein JHK86_044697 [Glycine max]KAG4951441.1 hypothetical protein JHK85_045308 [Glycine max]KAG5099297.1 hypothetical protein JHK82_044349 [Glycine max]KAG5107901.1 hypothetical protein JHK84_044808 [Glycine max]
MELADVRSSVLAASTLNVEPSCVEVFTDFVMENSGGGALLRNRRFESFLNTSSGLSRTLMWILGNPKKIEGAEYSNERAIYISNHASPIDIFLIMWLTPIDTIGIAKEEGGTPLSIETPPKSSRNTNQDLMKKLKEFDGLAMSIGNDHAESAERGVNIELLEGMMKKKICKSSKNNPGETERLGSALSHSEKQPDEQVGK